MLRTRLLQLFVPVVVLCGACTRVELVHKADAYDAAIWESNNRQILLNAVRASQRAPMSFVAFGEVTANPNFSGTTSGAFNFIPSGLTGYSVNPSVSYGAGFATFALSNLNQKEFAKAMHDPIDPKIAKHFREEKWPKEVVTQVLVQSIVLGEAEYSRIRRDAELKCRETDQRTVEFCTVIAGDKQARLDRNCPDPYLLEGGEFLNSAREFCNMNRFQILTRTLRLLGRQYPARFRSAEGILYYLGELIAAQNYSAQLHDPKVFIRAPDGRRYLMNLFVVRRGNPGPAVAAVQVHFNGEDFFIPRPQLGAIDEDRSLQVLDLATTAIVLATSEKSLPKSNNITLIPGR